MDCVKTSIKNVDGVIDVRGTITFEKEYERNWIILTEPETSEDYYCQVSLPYLEEILSKLYSYDRPFVMENWGIDCDSIKACIEVTKFKVFITILDEDRGILSPKYCVESTVFCKKLENFLKKCEK